MNTYNSISLTRFAATIAEIIGIEKPEHAEEPIDWVVSLFRDYCRGNYDRVLIHNPDAVAMWLFNKYPEMFEPVLKHTMLSLPLRTVMPSYTPVCFASMYTGAPPEVHGLQVRGEKPVVKIDTLFDSLLRNGKKVAIVAWEGCSMAKIFLGRDIDLFLYTSDADVEEKTHELIKEDRHDVICVYTYAYDKTDHKFGPEAPESMAALKSQADIFDRFVTSIKSCWKEYNTLVSFSTDHGVHLIDNPERPGAHGSDSPLDLNILHHLGAFNARK